MSLNLGMAASVAASHQNEYSSAHQAASPLYPDLSMANPLHYFQSRLQAWSSFSAKTPQLPTTIESTNASLSDLNESEHADDSGEQPNLEQPADSTPTVAKPKIPKTKTSYHLAYPPPITKHKQRFKLRPKVLLQLQRISETQRPRPTYDILPSTVFARGLGKRCGRISNSRTGLAPDDLIVARSQVYSNAKKRGGEDESSDDEDWDEREVLAAICQPKVAKHDNIGHMEIIMSHGPLWLATPLNNGYEFVSVDEAGQKTRARWIPAKPKGAGRRDSVDRKKFKFSILTRDCRRHPVIANMERGSINIADKYVIPETPVTSPALDSIHTASTHRSSESSYFSGNEYSGKQEGLVETDDDLRLLVITTGIWVAFCEGWSQNFSYNHDAAASKASCNTNSPLKARTLSSQFNFNTNETNRIPTPQSFASARSHQARLNILHRPSASASMSSAPNSPRLTSNPKIGMTPQRSNSLGTALHLRNARDQEPAMRSSLMQSSITRNVRQSRRELPERGIETPRKSRSLSNIRRPGNHMAQLERRTSEDSTLINTTAERTLPSSPSLGATKASDAVPQEAMNDGGKKSFFGRRNSVQKSLARKPSTMARVKSLFARKGRGSKAE